MEKIDIRKIRGRWINYSDGTTAGGDDTVESILMVAQKVNEIIDLLTSKKPE